MTISWNVFFLSFLTIQNKLNRRQLDLCPFALQQPRPGDSTWRSLAHSLLWTGWYYLIAYKLVPPPHVEHADPLQARRLTNGKTLIMTLRVSDWQSGSDMDTGIPAMFQMLSFYWSGWGRHAWRSSSQDFENKVLQFLLWEGVQRKRQNMTFAQFCLI